MTRKARIAHLAGPNATIQNTPPLVTSNKARVKHGLSLTGASGWKNSKPATGASGWKNSKPATAAPSLSILKRSSTVSSIGLNFFSNRSRPWRPRGTRCWLWDKRPSRRRQRCYLT